MASTRTELARLAGRVAAVEATNRIRNTKSQPETLIAIAGGIINIIDDRDPATVGIAMASYARTLLEAAERGAK